MNTIFCFGELLLRFSPLPGGSWLQQNTMPVYPGGAELNLATALAGWKLPVKYFTALPDNYLSHDVLGYLKAKNIDGSAIHISGNRIGSYYLQQGEDLKHAAVIYDRAYSSFAELKPGAIDWQEILKDAGWFHFSAISPALNKDVADVCKEALEAASKKGMTISVDLNDRPKLWQSSGRQPADVMPELVKYCHVVMGNIWSANSLLGIPVDKDIHKKKSKQAYLDHAAQTATALREKFPACSVVATTFRFDNEGNNINYYASLFTKGQQFNSAEFCCKEIVDKIGTGDCFMAGLIYGLYQQHELQDTINFASAAAFGKMQETGDATRQTVEEVDALLKSTLNNITH